MIVAMMMALAANAAPLAPVQRLSDAEVERVLAAAALRRAAAEQARPEPKREIEGEMGVAVGSDGYRAAYGSALVPLGKDGSASIQYSTETSRQRDGRRR